MRRGQQLSVSLEMGMLRVGPGAPAAVSAAIHSGNRGMRLTLPAFQLPPWKDL